MDQSPPLQKSLPPTPGWRIWNILLNICNLLSHPYTPWKREHRHILQHGPVFYQSLPIANFQMAILPNFEESTISIVRFLGVAHFRAIYPDATPIMSLEGTSRLFQHLLVKNDANPKIPTLIPLRSWW